MKKFITREYKGRRVNPDTGEVYEFSEVKEIVKTDQEPFFLTYSKQILALYDSNVFNATTKVLWKLLEFAEFNTGKVYMNSERVDDILRVCSISRTSYHRAINELIDIGIITKSRTTFTIAENMFWKGDKKAREEVINSKLMVSFSPVFNDENIEEQTN